MGGWELGGGRWGRMCTMVAGVNYVSAYMAKRCG